MKHSLNRARSALEEQIGPLRPVERFSAPTKGWVRGIRDAIGMSGAQLARRMGVAAQSVSDMEKSEAAATVRLETLSRAATALDCTLVYALVPNLPLEERMQQRARELALNALGVATDATTAEDQSIDDDLEARIQEFIDNTLRDRDLWADD